jgi:hypothetical protein
VVAVLAVSACSKPAPNETDGGALEAKLALASTSHDFGDVGEGERLVHVFRAENAGRAPLRLEPVRPAFGCTPEPWTRTDVPPGASAELRVACETEKRAGAFDVVLELKSNDPKVPEQKLRLRARVEPKLAFDALVVGLETDFGAPLTRQVRLRGKLSRAAKLEAPIFEKHDPSQPRVKILPADATRPMGLEFTLDAKRVADGAGGLRVKTGVPGRDPLALSFTYRVRGFVQVTPSRPYVNLRVPDEKVSVLISSRRSEFELTRVEIAEGPFRAELGERHRDGGRYVLVSAQKAELPADQRGALGRMVVFSNDPAEPAKDIPLFALGARAPGGASSAAESR